ncbi:hypothetical protein [Vibrio sp. Sgm 5]|uniref:hypothetical protein n=1 Tax=Vibrio sp. Sgm 5 TaxID=2994387 RepID=UPI0022496D57|nr:hypothetical protein [Vibrio sp. Sgm 5]MCX2792889.1 hypothetical protein [Vibrio sp. Sgm 5]
MLIERLIDSIHSLACIRCLKSGKDLYYNQAYDDVIQKNKNRGTLSDTISDTINKSKDIVSKASFTLCKHFDDTFKNNNLKTLASEEFLGCSKYYSIRTLINYKDSEAMLLIISKDEQPFSLDNYTINYTL